MKCRDGNSRGRSAKVEELRGIRRKFRAIKLHASSLRNHAAVHHDFATVPQFKRHTTITIKKRWSVLKAPRLSRNTYQKHVAVSLVSETIPAIELWYLYQAYYCARNFLENVAINTGDSV